jgi:hypothetical protein
VHNGLTPPAIRVAVDISSRRIVTIRLLQPSAWLDPEEQERLLRLVVESQTTEGSVPRGTEPCLYHGNGMRATAFYG